MLYLMRKVKTRYMIILAAFLYLLCYFRSCFFPLFSEDSLVYTTVMFFENVLVVPYFSFPIAIPWMLLGKMFAEKRFEFVQKKYIVSIIISVILLYVEWFVLKTLDGVYNHNVYLFLVPLTFSIFGLIKDIRVSIPNARMLRKISIISYPLHYSVVIVLQYGFHFLFETKSDWFKIILFFLTVSISHLAYLVISKLEKLKGLLRTPPSEITSTGGIEQRFRRD